MHCGQTVRLDDIGLGIGYPKTYRTAATYSNDSYWPSTSSAFTDGEVDGSRGAGREGDGDELSAFAEDGEGAVAAFDAECFDVELPLRQS